MPSFLFSFADFEFACSATNMQLDSLRIPFNPTLLIWIIHIWFPCLVCTDFGYCHEYNCFLYCSGRDLAKLPRLNGPSSSRSLDYSYVSSNNEAGVSRVNDGHIFYRWNLRLRKDLQRVNNQWIYIWWQMHGKIFSSLFCSFSFTHDVH